MFERNRFLAAHLQSSFRLRLAFQLLDEINKHIQGLPGLWQEHASVIEELAHRIEKGELNRYNLDDDYVTNHFRIGERMNSYLICDLAFYLAGSEAAKKEEDLNLEFLNEVEEKMSVGFYLGFNPRREDLCDLVKSLDGKALDIASRSRDLESRERSLRRFCEEIEKEVDEDAIIGRISYYNNGSYVELAQDIRALSTILEKREYWNEFYMLLENIRFFPLQGCLVNGIRNVRDVLAVIKLANTNRGRKSLHFLLREQFFVIICEEGSILRDNSEDGSLKDFDRAFIQQLLERYENKEKDVIAIVVDIWLKHFGKEEMSVWLSRKRAEAERKHDKNGRRELHIVRMMEEEVKLTSDDIKGFQLEDKDFPSLLTFASKAEDADVCSDVIQALVKCISEERFCPATTLDDNWFEQVRIIYRCLNKSGLNGLDLLTRVRKPLEGFRVDLGSSMRCVRQESYWLAMLLLSLEESEEEGFFSRYIDVLLRDTRYSLDSLTDDVFPPYYVAELLVSQVLTKKKDEYERRLIEAIPYLVFVIRVLTANEGVMSKEIMSLLGDRIQRDWAIERELLCQNRRVKVDFYDQFVKKYL